MGVSTNHVQGMAYGAVSILSTVFSSVLWQ